MRADPTETENDPKNLFSRHTAPVIIMVLEFSCILMRIVSPVWLYQIKDHDLSNKDGMI